MDAIIPPNGSTQPIVVEDRHRHAMPNVHVDVHDRRHDDCASTVRDMGIAELDAIQQNGYHNMNDTNRVGDRVSAGIERAGYHNSAEVNRVGDSLHGAAERVAFAQLNETARQGDKNVVETNRNGERNLNETSRQGDKNVVETNRNGDKVSSQVSFYGVHNLEAIKDTFAALRKDILEGDCNIKDRLADGFKDGLLQAANNTAALNQAICSSTKELLLQACDNHKDSQVAATSNFKDLLIEGFKNTAAVKDAIAQSAKEAAECCCETKELIRAQAQKTDDLVRDIDRDRIRDRNIELREELSVLRMRAGLTPPLVAAAAL